MPAIMLRCHVESHAKAPQARLHFRMESQMEQVRGSYNPICVYPTWSNLNLMQLGTRSPEECKTTTTFGSVAMKSRWKYPAANFRPHTNSKNIGPIINSRSWNSLPKRIEAFKASYRITAGRQLRRHPWRLKVEMLDSKLRSTESFGEFFFLASTNLRFVGFNYFSTCNEYLVRECLRKVKYKNFHQPSSNFVYASAPTVIMLEKSTIFRVWVLLPSLKIYSHFLETFEPSSIFWSEKLKTLTRKFYIQHFQEIVPTS